MKVRVEYYPVGVSDPLCFVGRIVAPPGSDGLIPVTDGSVVYGIPEKDIKERINEQ